MFADRLIGQTMHSVWTLIKGWEKPGDTMAAAGGLIRIAELMQRTSRAERLLQIATKIADTPEVLDNDREIHEALAGNEAVADLAVLAVPAGIDDDDSEEPVLVGRGVLRVAARFTGEPLERRNRMSDGRLAVARMIGYGPNARDAQLALIELATAICRPEAPACSSCPLAGTCVDRRSTLF
jgi:DNA (cytosine-5)-methyltransferase 1